MLIEHAQVCRDCLSGEVAVVTGAGRGIDGWEKAAGAAVATSRKGGAEAVDPEYAAQLRRLADHLVRCEADWRGYVTDPQKLEEGIVTLERRRAAVASLAAALVRERTAAIA